MKKKQHKQNCREYPAGSFYAKLLTDKQTNRQKTETTLSLLLVVHKDVGYPHLINLCICTVQSLKLVRFPRQPIIPPLLNKQIHRDSVLKTKATDQGLKLCA